jgi:cholesterol transport system auxiliary component
MTRIFSVAALLALAACGPLVQIGGNATPPDALLTLRAAGDMPASVGVDPATTLGITVPSVPGTLQTLRLPVTTTDTEVQYLKAANWAEQPAKLFQRLLGDVAAAQGIAVIDSRQSDVTAARKLTGTLREFGLDVRAAPLVRVRYEAMLTGRDGRLLAMRRFEATQPVAGQTPGEVGAALNTAANAVAADVAAWAASTR